MNAIIFYYYDIFLEIIIIFPQNIMPYEQKNTQGKDEEKEVHLYKKALSSVVSFLNEITQSSASTEDDDGRIKKAAKARQIKKGKIYKNTKESSAIKKEMRAEIEKNSSQLQVRNLSVKPVKEVKAVKPKLIEAPQEIERKPLRRGRKPLTEAQKLKKELQKENAAKKKEEKAKKQKEIRAKKQAKTKLKNVKRTENSSGPIKVEKEQNFNSLK
ncbi:hypothetical protein NUSPORA_01891 [Nucleospora cyclopteri]